ncbi:aldehyde dehydrogenase family protein, partial [Sphingobacterium daejeonense]|uniref:aldehyde dehydrogenase family protein n=1 Tax=Sphingobacterium daejeonense TaxID=371142 RepID=UPI003D315421
PGPPKTSLLLARPPASVCIRSQDKARGCQFLAQSQIFQRSGYESGCYVTPVIAEVENHYEIVQHETFAPILYLIKYKGEVDEAIALQLSL